MPHSTWNWGKWSAPFTTFALKQLLMKPASRVSCLLLLSEEASLALTEYYRMTQERQRYEQSMHRVQMEFPKDFYSNVTSFRINAVILLIRNQKLTLGAD